MRKLAEELDVVPMALYKHIANKDQLPHGMLDVVIGETDALVNARLLHTRGLCHVSGCSARRGFLSTSHIKCCMPWALYGFTQEVFNDS